MRYILQQYYNFACLERPHLADAFKNKKKQINFQNLENVITEQSPQAS